MLRNYYKKSGFFHTSQAGRTVPIYYTSNDQIPHIPTGEIYLVFHDSVSEKEAAEFIDTQKFKVTQTRNNNSYVVMVPEGEDPKEIEDRFRGKEFNSLLKVVEADFSTPIKKCRSGR